MNFGTESKQNLRGKEYCSSADLTRKSFFFVLYLMIVVFPIEDKGAVHVVANGTCPKHKLPRFKPDIATY